MFNHHNIIRLAIITVVFVCVSAQYRQGDIRLVGGSVPNEGRVEIYVNGEWGTVCDDDWGTNDAKVVCRQLGYSTSDATEFSCSHFGQGVGQIALDNVNCTSSESSLLDCRRNELFVHNCAHYEDAGVRCSERLKHISADVIIISLTSAVSTVSISWELQNTTLDEPSMFRVECFNEMHNISILKFVNNQTYTTELLDFLQSTRYNCCVSALYGLSQLYATILRVICTSVYIPELVTNSPSFETDTLAPTTTSAETPDIDSSSTIYSAETDSKRPDGIKLLSSSSYSANIVGGVLGSVIIVLLILLGLSGTALLYLLIIVRRKQEAETATRNWDSHFVDVNLTVQNNLSYVTTLSQLTSSVASSPGPQRGPGDEATSNGAITQTVSHSGATGEEGIQECGKLEVEYESIDSGRSRQPAERGKVNMRERYEFAEIHNDGEETEAASYEVPANLCAEGHDHYSHLKH